MLAPLDLASPQREREAVGGFDVGAFVDADVADERVDRRPIERFDKATHARERREIERRAPEAGESPSVETSRRLGRFARCAISLN